MTQHQLLSLVDSNVVFVDSILVFRDEPLFKFMEDLGYIRRISGVYFMTPLGNQYKKRLEAQGIGSHIIIIKSSNIDALVSGEYNLPNNCHTVGFVYNA